MSISAVLWYDLAILQGMSHKFVDWGNATLLGLAELQVSIVPFKVSPFVVHTLGSVSLSHCWNHLWSSVA